MRWIVIGWAIAALSVIASTLGATLLARRRAARGEGPGQGRMARWLAAGPSDRALSLGLSVAGVFVVIPLLLFATVKLLPDDWTPSREGAGPPAAGSEAALVSGPGEEPATGDASSAREVSGLPVPEQMAVYRALSRLEGENRCAARELHPDNEDAQAEYVAAGRGEVLATVSRRFQVPEAEVRRIKTEGERRLWPVSAASCE